MATSVGAATNALLLAGVGAASGAAAALWAGSSGGVGSCSRSSGGACCSSGGLGSALSPGRGRRDDEPRVRLVHAVQQELQVRTILHHRYVMPSVDLSL